MNLKGGGAQNLKSAFVHVVFFTLKPKKRFNCQPSLKTDFNTHYMCSFTSF